jgi:hypothetical protein
MTAEVLWARLQDLLDATLALRRTAVDDRPAGDAMLLDLIDDELAGLLAVVQEAAATAPAARQARHDLAAERGGAWRAWNVALDQDLACWQEALRAARGR